jgi:hypothetical protein
MAPSELDLLAGPPLHHGLKDWSAILLIAAAAVLLSPMLVGRHAESEWPQPASASLGEPSLAAAEPAVLPAAADRAIYEQFIQMDEIFITAVDGDMGVRDDARR